MSTAELEPQEHRREKRTAVARYLMQLDPLDGRYPLACAIWDLSETGAQLELLADAIIPATVAVTIGGVRRPSRIVWRDGNHIGIQFS